MHLFKALNLKERIQQCENCHAYATQIRGNHLKGLCLSEPQYTFPYIDYGIRQYVCLICLILLDNQPDLCEHYQTHSHELVRAAGYNRTTLKDC